MERSSPSRKIELTGKTMSCQWQSSIWCKNLKLNIARGHIYIYPSLRKRHWIESRDVALPEKKRGRPARSKTPWTQRPTKHLKNHIREGLGMQKHPSAYVKFNGYPYSLATQGCKLNLMSARNQWRTAIAGILRFFRSAPQCRDQCKS